MTALAAFMHELIDYAGLFPPAELPMDRVVANYARLRAAGHADKLGRLICPAQRLAEMGDLANDLIVAADVGQPWRISALGRGADNADEFHAHLSEDLEAVVACRKRFGPRVVVDVFECPLPRGLLEDGDQVAAKRLAQAAAQRIADDGPDPLVPFYEVAFVGHWREHLPQVIAGLGEANAALSAARVAGGCGVKLRTGGVRADLFPSVDEVTLVLRECLTRHLPFKATAGLHHPVRHFAESVNTKMHGFLNVFGAAVLAHAHDLDASTIACIVEDEAAEHFAFESEVFRWQDFSARAVDIARARQDYARGYGSCSFDEPIEDLKQLGML
jgi:nucleotide-binding universal stress UspA family protein